MLRNYAICRLRVNPYKKIFRSFHVSGKRKLHPPLKLLNKKGLKYPAHYYPKKILK